MKPTLVADEMFPEGAGPFMELDEVIYMRIQCLAIQIYTINANELIINKYLPDNLIRFEQAGGSSGLLMDLAANEKDVHSDFFNGNFYCLTLIK